MSTAKLFMDNQEIEEFLYESLTSDSLYVFGEEDHEIGLCPYISFYIYHREDDYNSVADSAITLCEKFRAFADEPIELLWKDETQDWLPAGDPRLPLAPRPQARKCFDDREVFILGGTDQANTVTTPRWAYSGLVDWKGMSYSYLKFTFRHKWYTQNKLCWHAFVRECIEQLQPEQCYSGFEVGNGGFNIVGAYECDVLERICADYLYGMDIDHPSKMAFHSFMYDKDDPIYAPEACEDLPPDMHYVDPTDLGAGIRTPTWCFILSPYWMKRLGKTEAQVRAELKHPDIEITTIEYEKGPHNPDGLPALWIRLGELDLHPVDKGIPEVLVMASRLIRPIRCDQLKLLTLAPWDDDPNPRFDYDSSIRWMRRFDEDSDWPDAARRAGPSSLKRPNVPAGEPCPETGWWFTPAKADSRRYFKQGETMPDVGGDYGATFWQWSPDQSAPSL